MASFSIKKKDAILFKGKFAPFKGALAPNESTLAPGKSILYFKKCG